MGVAEGVLEVLNCSLVDLLRFHHLTVLDRQMGQNREGGVVSAGGSEDLSVTQPGQQTLLQGFASTVPTAYRHIETMTDTTPTRLFIHRTLVKP